MLSPHSLSARSSSGEMNLVESVNINTRQAQCPWSQAWSKNAVAITPFCECTVGNDGEKRDAPAGNTWQGLMRERQQGVGVWRRDGRDCEHPCAPDPVPLVMRLPNSAEVSRQPAR